MKSKAVADGRSPSNECDDEDEPLRCLDCRVNFTTKHYLHSHLLCHIKQPVVKLDDIQISHPPLKITFKNRSGNSFEIVSPVTSPRPSEPGCSSNSLDEASTEDLYSNTADSEEFQEEHYEEESEPPSEEPEKDYSHEEDDSEDVDDEYHEEHDHPVPDCHDPFDEELEGSGDNDNNTRDSAAGSVHSSEETSQEAGEDRTTVNFSPNLAEVIGGAFLADIDSPIPFEAPSTDEQPQESPKEADTAERADDNRSESDKKDDNTAQAATLSNGSHANSPPYGSIPGAEPTPPPEPSPTGATEYPKIKIKTTGLFKDPEPRGCTITEVTDDNPSGDPGMSSNNSAPIWTTPSLEDPLKLPDSDNLLSFLNSDRNNKDMGYSSSSDNEFISLDTFNEKNRGAMQLYNSNNSIATSSSSSSSLDSLTGLPMQALAQQVSRLNPSVGQGLHQQNVLINIQQFPSQPQQPYPQHQQPMYPHYPPQPPMHQPYPYQPPNQMYPHYPPAPGYPQQHPPPASHMPPPPPQLHQMQPPPHMQQQQGNISGQGQPPNSMPPSTQGQQMPPPSQMPPPNQMQQPPNSMQGGYRPPMPPSGRAPAPRGPQPGAPRMPGGPRPPMNNRTPGARPRAPMVRPRGGPGGQPVRGQIRPRMSGNQNGPRPGNQTSPIKRSPDQNHPAGQIKRKRVDVLTPSDKDDDDCQVICMQPKNTGLPQIESVQGASESVESSIMKLSDSITLSVRNPPPKPTSNPQSKDAKAVANVLASRGITVTASGKGKDSPTKSAIPSALSLNGAVSIVASNKNAKPASENLPTVDLTDESPPASNSPGKNRPGLPYRCDLCPAQYPNAMGLNKHRQTYHKTNSGMCELGVPLINIKQPGIMQKLSQMGINNYIPLPSAGPEGTYALPIISTKNPGNVAALGATQMLSLGPVRQIPKPGATSNSPIKK